ncbi:CD3337/EF1877 family mobilome membrane protein [Priestia megaterium]
MNSTTYKQLLSAILILFVFFSHSSLTHADSLEDAAKNISVEEKKYGPYKNKTPYYMDINVINYKDLKEIQEKEQDKDEFTLNPFTAIGNYFSDKTEDIVNNSKDMMVSTLLMMVTLIFQFNIMMTEFLVTCLDAAMNADVINFLIDLCEQQVQLISGVEGGKISEGKGIFGGLAGLAGLICIVYVVYLFTIKRAPLAGLQALLQPILIITLSIVFFSNFTMILKGVNSLSTELTNSIASATPEGDTDSIADNIQKVFVHRPYLYLQFNSGNETKIGQKRIDSLLLSKPGSEEKRKAVKREIKEYKNSMLEPGSVIKRLIYTGLFVCVNSLLSVPVWILAFLFIGLQIWFLLIASISPFVLVWAILPGQTAVMRRFGIEMIYPMGLKVILGFLSLVIFTFSRLAFAIPATTGLTGYYLSTFFQFVFFFVLFLIRNRIKAIFNSTTGFVREMRQSTQIVMQPAKNTVENTAMLVGGAVGAATGNPSAAVQGAAIGRNLGKTLIGEKDALGTTAQLVSLADVSSRENQKEAQAPVTGKTSSNSRPTKTPVVQSTKEGNTPNSKETPTLEGTTTNETKETTIPYKNKGQKENTQSVSSIYVPIQDLEDFKPSTDTGKEVKKQVVGSQTSKDYKESKLPRQQENTKAQSLRDLNKKQLSTPTNIETSTSLEKTKPTYQEIHPYNQKKDSSISKTTGTLPSVTNNEDLSNKDLEEQTTEERPSQFKNVSQYRNKDFNINDHDLNKNE